MADYKDLNHIDWNLLWQQERSRQSWQGRSAADWDHRAATFVKRHAHSPFIDNLLALVEVDSSWSVLDIGAGPGTLALPLAGRARQITAVDFSANMLAELEQRRIAAGLTNIRTIQAAWEEDWTTLGIGRHDLVIACRSLAVHDLRAALHKIIDHACRRAIIVERVGATPFDPELFAAVGRPFRPGPDYIYTINLLYQLGITAELQLIQLPATATFPSPAAARESCAWMLEEITEQEAKQLDAYLQQRVRQNNDGSYRLQRSQGPCWAVISWDVSRTCKPTTADPDA